MNTVLIIGLKLSQARIQKLYDENGVLRRPEPKKGKSLSIHMQETPTAPSTFLVKGKDELYVGFPVFDTAGRYLEQGAAKAEDMALLVGSMAELTKLYRDQLKGAQKRWNTFSMWASEAHEVSMGIEKMLLIIEKE